MVNGEGSAGTGTGDPPPPVAPTPDQLSPSEIAQRIDMAMEKAREAEIQRLAEEEAETRGVAPALASDRVRQMLMDTSLGVKQEARQLTKDEKSLVSQLQALTVSAANVRSKEEATKTLQQSVVGVLDAIDNTSLDPEAKKVVTGAIANALQAGDLPVKSPDFVTEMRLPAMREQYQDKGVVPKLIHRVKPFTGIDKDYKWSQFWTRYSIAIQNSTYSRHDLRVVFLSSLDGPALNHYTAYMSVYNQMSYEQIVQAFKERYDDTRELSLASITSESQGANEDVLTFRDRLLNKAAPFRPVRPVDQVIVQAPDGKDRLMPNAQYATQMLQYEAKVQETEIFITQFFVKGLREEILARLTRTNYERLEDAAKAAKEAEDYLRSIALMRTNHIRVHAMYKGTNMPRGAQLEGADGSKSGNSKDSSRDECFSCGATGHWRRNCPYRNRSRSNSRGRSRSRSRGRTSFDETKFVNMLEAAVEKVCMTKFAKNQKRTGKHKNKDAKKARSKSRSRSRTRDGSRERHRSSSRGSHYGSRSNSRNRAKN